MRKSLDYRPEIDGLRAVAVFSVIFYHSSVLIFEKKFLPGGFIGVDIFFVISGYLITKLISNEFQFIYDKIQMQFTSDLGRINLIRGFGGVAKRLNFAKILSHMA